MRVILIPEVEDYLYELVEILYRNEYFGFKSSAVSYVVNLISEIENNIQFSTRRKAPLYFNRYGKDLLCSFFSINKSTTWYVFYSIYLVGNEEVYVIKFITNNHVHGRYFNQ